jgi:hypothetical protein
VGESGQPSDILGYRGQSQSYGNVQEGRPASDEAEVGAVGRNRNVSFRRTRGVDYAKVVKVLHRHEALLVDSACTHRHAVRSLDLSRREADGSGALLITVNEDGLQAPKMGCDRQVYGECGLARPAFAGNTRCRLNRRWPSAV